MLTTPLNTTKRAKVESYKEVTGFINKPLKKEDLIFLLIK